MKWLVTGGAGFIGCNVVRRLLELQQAAHHVASDEPCPARHQPLHRGLSICRLPPASILSKARQSGVSTTSKTLDMSVVISTYNRARSLPRALESLMDQAVSYTHLT